MTSPPPPPPGSSSGPHWATPRETVERWALVTARDVMRKNVVTIPASAPLSEVQQVLADNRIGGAPVVDETGAIVGILSLKDLVDHFTEEPDAHPVHRTEDYDAPARDLFDEDLDQDYEVEAEEDEEGEEEQDEETAPEATAQDIMSAQVHSVRADAGLKEIAGLMAKHKLHRVLVHENGRHVGLISTLEILDALCA